ncbi:hypothetical protein LXJ58_36155, partial [Escherichia coli]|nr:hypothetical protein [Escherichia coli]
MAGQCDPVLDEADSLDLAAYDIALLQEDGRLAGHADAFGRAGRDEVARLERERGREIADLVGDRMDHLARVRALSKFAIYPACQRERLRIGDF